MDRTGLCMNFCHIPKTAGTSFRNALESKFGVDAIVRDYGKNAPETSQVVQESVYERQDLYSLYTSLVTDGTPAIAGHFSADKYARVFSVTSSITFMREPVERVISEYKHFKRHKNINDSLIEFARLPRNINAQTRYLRSVSLYAMGLVGITERYSESLQLFEHEFGIKLEKLNNNIAPRSRFTEKIGDEVISEITEINHDDISLYRNAKNLLGERVNLLNSNLPFTFGTFYVNRTGKLQGWAFRRNISDIPQIHIIVNGRFFTTVLAKDFNVALNSFRAPRKGYVGFNVTIPDGIAIDKIECIVSDTNQRLHAS